MEIFPYLRIHPDPQNLTRPLIHILRDQRAAQSRIAACEWQNLPPQKLRDPASDPGGGVAREVERRFRCALVPEEDGHRRDLHGGVEGERLEGRLPLFGGAAFEGEAPLPQDPAPGEGLVRGHHASVDFSDRGDV